MDKTFNTTTEETRIYNSWIKSDYFSPNLNLDLDLDLDSNTPNYSIPLPPPNVTGSLHMGHGFQDVIMDILTRYYRMRGYNTLWQPGTDHAGIATQIVVERQLQKENLTRYDLGRTEFLHRIWAWKEESGNNILNQMQRLGVSCDWSKTKFSMDPDLNHATQTAFIRLYNEGLIYKGTRLVNWDPKLKTALSDLEVTPHEVKGSLWHIEYPLESNPNQKITIATTRPETLLGDTAIAVHPEDARYKNLIGQNILLPLTDRVIPIIADEYVDKDFGTGCVKITPAHDFNDYEVGKRNNLPMINILNKDGTLNHNCPEKYQNIDRLEARKIILKDLESLNFLAKTQDHILQQPRSERTQEVVEPMLSDQWYIKIDSLAQPAIKAVKDKKIRFIPENTENLFFSWMNDIQDWCISRQLWWGHQIPAWYDQNDNIYVGESEEKIRLDNNLDPSIQLTQDPDVLDTWFTAALWPFSSLGWPAKTPESIDLLKHFYPHNVLVTGFDIIFFWVARMIMFGLKFMGDVPFKDVYIHGLIRDHEGQKMSKSKGNVLDPIDLIDGVDLETLIQKRTFGLMNPNQQSKVIKSTKKAYPNGIDQYGCDALRFTYTALASTSRNINFSTDRLEGYRNFCNKLWNAAKFVKMHLDQNLEFNYSEKNIDHISNPINIWMQCVLNQTIQKTHEFIQNYRFDHLAQNLYETIWNQFCDWYLELSKVSLFSDDQNQKYETLNCLLFTLFNLIKLTHPIMPFITESIYQIFKPYLKSEVKSLMISSFPEINKKLDLDLNLNKTILDQTELLKSLISQVRTLRSEIQISPSIQVPLFIKHAKPEDQKIINTLKPWIASLAKIESINWDIDTEKTITTTGFVGHLELHIPLEGLIDLSAEKERLEKNLSKLEAEIKKLNQMLNNPNYIQRAPEAVVEKSKAQLKQSESELEIIQKQWAKFK